MKTLYLTLLFTGIFYNSAVSQTILGIRHIFKENTSVSYITKTDTTHLTVKSKKLKGHLGFEKGVAVIDFWSITKDPYKDDTTAVRSTLEVSDTQRLILDVGRRTLAQHTLMESIPFRGVVLGAFAIPFKYRRSIYIDNVKFLPQATSNSFSLGATLGYTFGQSDVTHRGINNKSLTIGLFAGPTTSEVKSSTSIAQNFKDRTYAGVTYGANIILSRNNYGFIIAYGFDSLFGEQASTWAFQNKGWIGFGLNTSLSFFK